MIEDKLMIGIPLFSFVITLGILYFWYDPYRQKKKSQNLGKVSEK